MKPGVILSIDQGTTGTTVLIFDHSGQVRSRSYSEFTQHIRNRDGLNTTRRRFAGLPAT